MPFIFSRNELALIAKSNVIATVLNTPHIAASAVIVVGGAQQAIRGHHASSAHLLATVVEKLRGEAYMYSTYNDVVNALKAIPSVDEATPSWPLGPRSSKSQGASSSSDRVRSVGSQWRLKSVDQQGQGLTMASPSHMAQTCNLGPMLAKPPLLEV